MPDKLAYHVVVHALEAKGGQKPMRRFSLAGQSALNGHLPYQRYYRAGLARHLDHTGEDAVERLVHEHLTLDLNPLTQSARCVTSMQAVLQGYNDYNAKANLGTRTHIASWGEDQRRHRVRVERSRLAMRSDPSACQHATYSVFNELMREVRQRPAVPGGLKPLRRMSDVLLTLGLECSMVAEACHAIEGLGLVSVEELARELGVHQRTLERRLHEEGLTAESLRMVDRLLRALDSMRTGRSLAQVAVDAGFSDQPHLTRVFRSSCGLTPGFFKKLLKS